MGLRTHLDTLWAAWRAETERRRAGRARHTDTEFLPAALEIAESPPSPIGRSILWSILAVAVLAIVWAFVGRIDIVAVAEGRIIPSGRLQSIEANEPGLVRSIHVREGAQVRAGDPLVSLDPTFVAADVGAAVAEFSQAALAAARAGALLSYANGGPPEFVAPADADPVAVNAERQAVLSRIAAYEGRIAGLEARAAAARSAIETARAEIARIDATLPLAREQLSARQELDRQGYGARLVTLQAEERVVSLTYDRRVRAGELARATSELALIQRETDQARAEFRAEAATELSQGETSAAARRESATKARERARLQTLAAPLDGTIVEVAVTTIGERVEAGAPLMTLVPSGQELVVEALVLNRDAGFVAVGDRVVIKLEAYPFTRFGFLEGRVERIAADAVTDERRGLVFPVRVRLASTTLTRAAGRELRVTPGMSATVEITTGRRRVIDFILSPISRAVQEAGRER
jgi:hemolysin D